MTTRLPHVDYHLDLANLPWRVRSVHLTEQLDAPFTADLHLLTTTSITPSDLLLTPATITFRRGNTTRTFRGEVTRARVATPGTSDAVGEPESAESGALPIRDARQLPGSPDVAAHPPSPDALAPREIASPHLPQSIRTAP